MVSWLVIGLFNTELVIGLFNTELSPERYWRGSRSLKLGEGRTVQNYCYTVTTKTILNEGGHRCETF